MERLDRFKIMKARCIIEPRKEGAELTSDSRALLDYIENLLKLEQEIGCPLEVRCELYDGQDIYTSYNGVGYTKIVTIKKYGVVCDTDEFDSILPYNEYGKTWCLRDENIKENRSE